MKCRRCGREHPIRQLVSDWHMVGTKLLCPDCYKKYQRMFRRFLKEKEYKHEA